MLEPRQVLTLQALVDTIIPEDDYPGGWESGLGDYLLGQLQSDLRDSLATYRDWLDALEIEADKVFQHPFAGLDLASRTALLEAIEQGDIKSDWPVDQAGFFAQIVEHCTEGYYADPGNGANRDGAAWAMVGFEVTA
ncbi:MAG: gluconate 2-dehydrogenase subunit 3 family protein [Chloroflexi bacterium]|nr:gluconate 2-dehydrogenase subunit 3 family protein [Chloroflexota bacterium]